MFRRAGVDRSDLAAIWTAKESSADGNPLEQLRGLFTLLVPRSANEYPFHFNRLPRLPHILHLNFGRSEITSTGRTDGSGVRQCRMPYQNGIASLEGRGA